MPPTKPAFHAALGRISIAFASLEHQVREIIIQIAFRGEWTTAAALIEDHSLAKNLDALNKLSRKENDVMQERIARFVKSIIPLRRRRNLFVHGMWRLTKEDLERGVIEVSALRLKYEKTAHGQMWRRGVTEEITFPELRSIEADVVSALKEANEICETIMDREDP